MKAPPFLSRPGELRPDLESLPRHQQWPPWRRHSSSVSSLSSYQGLHFTSTNTGTVARPSVYRRCVASPSSWPYSPDGLSPFLSSALRTTQGPVQWLRRHENSNGQASFENPMYDTNLKPTEAKAVRLDTTLNTVCTVV